MAGTDRDAVGPHCVGLSALLRDVRLAALGPHRPGREPGGGLGVGVTATFWVSGPLPGMNEIVAAAKSGRGRSNAYSRMKAQWTSHVASWARKERLGHFASPVTVRCLWREPDARRDPDNVHAGVKFVLDGLVLAGVLAGDRRKNIVTVSHVIETMAKPGGNPGVYVTIEPMEEPAR